MLPRCPGQLVFQHGVGAGAGLAHAVLDVGQRAHGELQAVGQVGAVAVAQRDAPTHDVVAEAFQGVSVQVHRRGDPPPPGARLQDSGERLQNLVR